MGRHSGPQLGDAQAHRTFRDSSFCESIEPDQKSDGRNSRSKSFAWNCILSMARETSGETREIKILKIRHHERLERRRSCRQMELVQTLNEYQSIYLIRWAKPYVIANAEYLSKPSRRQPCNTVAPDAVVRLCFTKLSN